ncbi:flippase [Eisenbergiella sp.]
MKKETEKIISNVAWMTFDKIFMLALNLLVTVKIANHFGALGYGTYQYAVNVVAIFEILVTFVDGRVVKKRYISFDEDEVVTTATISRVLFSLLSLLIGIIYIILTEQKNDFAIMFIILLLNAIVGNLKFGLANRFEYILKSKKIVIASDCAALLASVLQLLAVRYNWSVIAISIIALISSIINLCILVVQYSLQFKSIFKGKFNKSLLKELVKESFPLAVAASCATIYTRCDSVMLGSMMTASEVGIYSISAKLISIVQIAIVPIRESVYPKLIQLYSTNRKEYEKQYIKISSLMTWIFIIGVALSFGVLPIAFKFLNAEYSAAFPIYKIHVLGTLFMYNAALRAGHFTLIGRGTILTYSQLISVVVNVILNYYGIKTWGMYGAAIATAVTQCLSLMFSNLLFKKDGYEVFWWQVKAFNPLYIFK